MLLYYILKFEIGIFIKSGRISFDLNSDLCMFTIQKLFLRLSYIALIND